MQRLIMNLKWPIGLISLSLAVLIGLCELLFVLLLKIQITGLLLPYSASSGLSILVPIQESFGNYLLRAASTGWKGLVFIAMSRSLFQALQTRGEQHSAIQQVIGFHSDMFAQFQSKAIGSHQIPPSYGKLFSGHWDFLFRGPLARSRCFAAAIQGLLFLLLLIFLYPHTIVYVSGFTVLAALLSRSKVNWLKRLNRRWNHSQEMLMPRSKDFFRRFEEIKGNQSLPTILQQCQQYIDSARKNYSNKEFWTALFPVLLELFLFIFLALLLSFIGKSSQELNPALSMIQVLPFAVLLLLMYRPLREWANYYPAYLEASLERQDLKQTQAWIEQLPDWKPAQFSPQDKLEIQNLHFRYGMATWIFKDFNLKLPASGRVLIRGANGTGKSSLVKLIAGAEYSSQGAIVYPEVWKVKSNSTSANSLPALAYLSQNPWPSQNFYENWKLCQTERPSLYSKLDGLLDIDRVLKDFSSAQSTSLKEADNFHDWQGLSVGQRQRICIAEKLLRPQGLLLLDEPSNALPGLHRIPLLENLIELWLAFGGKSVYIVSHEEGWNLSFDQIVEL